VIRALKFCGLLTVNVCVAVFGTAVLESAVGSWHHPASISGVVLKTWFLSVLCAAAIGSSMWRAWGTSATKWTWLLPSIWFGLRAMTLLTRGSLWAQFSGAGCQNGMHDPGCLNFFVFTIPFIRGLSYSVGAYLLSLVSSHRVQSKDEPLERKAIAPPSGQ
jgi:hypothetical protein